MNIYEIPCNADGRKVRVLDSNATGVKLYVNTPCNCPLCLDDDNDVKLIEGFTECGNNEDEYFEERISDCFE